MGSGTPRPLAAAGLLALKSFNQFPGNTPLAVPPANQIIVSRNSGLKITLHFSHTPETLQYKAS